MTKNRFQAVFFDFGGTLFSYRDLAEAPNSPVREAVAQLGVNVERGQVGHAYWKATKDAFEIYTPKSFYLHRDLFRETFDRFARALGALPSPSFLDDCVERQRVYILDHFRLREDCIETLKTLRDSGHYLSIVSNIDDDYLDEMVPRAGLHEILHHWSSSEEAQSCKPDSRFFHFAMQKAGVSAHEVLFVGDSPTHDIAGARAVGMTTALISDEENPVTTGDDEPDYRIEALTELLVVTAVGDSPIA